MILCSGACYSGAVSCSNLLRFLCLVEVAVSPPFLAGH